MIISLLILITLFGGYLLSYRFAHSLPAVEAGPMDRATYKRLIYINDNLVPSYKKSINGISHLFRRFVVKGTCMEEKNINNGSIVNARIFNSTEEKLNLKNGDVVLIYLNDKKFRGYKLRCVKNVNLQDVETFYYNKGKEIPSSKPHKLDSIIGIIEP